jgi:hypothetical protein
MAGDARTSEDGSPGKSAQAAVVQRDDGGCVPVMAAEGKLPGQDSNLDKENQNLLCYRYTTGYQDDW